MNKEKNEIKAIDAVVLWVDGNDEKHMLKMLPYVENKEKFKTKSFKTRYEHVNEIKFTIDSIIKFAPFIRNIFIVTDNQTPDFIINNKQNYKNVSIVDHQDIFKGHEAFLPTFNCRSIETCMYRIPNLAEHFIYFNDDFFLINKTRPSDFFKNGYPILRGKWRKFPEDIFYKKLKKPRIGHKTAQQMAAKLLGFKQYYNFRHTPHPLRKSTFEKYFNEHEDVFIENIKYKFRSSHQFTPQGLANHLEIKHKTFTLQKDLQLMYFRSYKKSLFWYQLKLNFLSKNKLFLGLQSLDKCTPNKLNFFLQWLNKRICNS